EFPTAPIKRGKVLSAEELEKVGAFARYKDVDGDGIPYRTLPGTKHRLAPYFTRGSGHNASAKYSERPGDYSANMERLEKKFETARTRVPVPEIEASAAAKIGIIGYGTSHWAIDEARHILRNGQKQETSYLRLRAFPFNHEVKKFIEQHERVYVIDQNRDGQMHSILRLELPAALLTKVHSVKSYNGLPLTARSIVEGILAQEN
ncbi:MAG: 2-oxoacid:acceptor oxidoreductase subunit alpha, partial [candidate division KSB1 bacterium]